MTGGGPVLARNGRKVSQIEMSARIRQIAEESRNLKMNPVFGELTGILELNRHPRVGAGLPHIGYSEDTVQHYQTTLFAITRSSIPAPVTGSR